MFLFFIIINIQIFNCCFQLYVFNHFTLIHFKGGIYPCQCCKSIDLLVNCKKFAHIKMSWLLLIKRPKKIQFPKIMIFTFLLISQEILKLYQCASIEVHQNKRNLVSRFTYHTPICSHISICTYTYMDISIQDIEIHVHTRMYKYIDMYIQIHRYTCIFRYAHTHTSICTYTSIRTHT